MAKDKVLPATLYGFWNIDREFVLVEETASGAADCLEENFDSRSVAGIYQLVREVRLEKTTTVTEHPVTRAKAAKTTKTAKTKGS